MLFNPGAQSLTGTFDPVYVTREAVARGLERHASAVGRRRVDAALRWLVHRADVGWRQVGAARQLFLPAIHHAAAVHLGLWLLVWQSVLPEVQCKSRYHRRTRDGSSPGSVVLGQGDWLPQSCANSSAPPCFIYSPGEVRRGRPLDGIDLPRRLCLGHARRHSPALRFVLDRGHSAGPGRAASDRGSL